MAQRAQITPSHSMIDRQLLQRHQYHLSVVTDAPVPYRDPPGTPGGTRKPPNERRACPQCNRLLSTPKYRSYVPYRRGYVERLSPNLNSKFVITCMTKRAGIVSAKFVTAGTMGNLYLWRKTPLAPRGSPDRAAPQGYEFLCNTVSGATHNRRYLGGGITPLHHS